MIRGRGDLLVGFLHCFFESKNQSTSLFLKMEPIAMSAFVVYLDMSSIDAGSFKQVQKNGKVFYNFENFTGRVGTRLFVTEGSQSIEIGRSETTDNNTRPGSRKAVPTTKKGRSGKRKQNKKSAAALSILDESSSGSNDSVLMEDLDDTEVLKKRLRPLRTDKSVRFTEERSEDEESEFKSEEEESSVEGNIEAEESSKEESKKEDPDKEQGGGSEEEDPSNERRGDNEGKEEASEDDGGSKEEVASNKQGDIERKEVSKEEGKEEAGDTQQGDSKQEKDNADGDNGSDNKDTGEDCNKKLPIDYSALKKKELEMECRLQDLTSDGKKRQLSSNASKKMTKE